MPPWVPGYINPRFQRYRYAPLTSMNGAFTAYNNRAMNQNHDFGFWSTILSRSDGDLMYRWQHDIFTLIVQWTNGSIESEGMEKTHFPSADFCLDRRCHELNGRLFLAVLSRKSSLFRVSHQCLAKNCEICFHKAEHWWRFSGQGLTTQRQIHCADFTDLKIMKLSLPLRRDSSTWTFSINFDTIYKLMMSVPMTSRSLTGGGHISAIK